MENLFENNNEGEFTQSGKGNRHASPGSTESQRDWIQGETHEDTSQLHYPRVNIRRESEKQQEKRK